MNKQQAITALQFLDRVELRGNEVTAFTQARDGLIQICEDSDRAMQEQMIQQITAESERPDKYQPAPDEEAPQADLRDS